VLQITIIGLSDSVPAYVLGPILHCFGDIAGFCAHDPTLIPDRPCWGQCMWACTFKLFGREIIFQVFQPVWKHTWTSETDGQTTYCGI